MIQDISDSVSDGSGSNALNGISDGSMSAFRAVRGGDSESEVATTVSSLLASSDIFERSDNLLTPLETKTRTRLKWQP